MTPAPTTTPPRILVPHRTQFYAFPGTPDHVVGWVAAHLRRQGAASPAMAAPLRLLAGSFPRGARFRAVCWPDAPSVTVHLDPLEPLAQDPVVDEAAMAALLADGQWGRQPTGGGWWMEAPTVPAREDAPV